MGLAVGCGTPAPRPTTAEPPPSAPPDARPDAVPDAPRPDAAPIPVDATVVVAADAAVAVAPVVATGRIRGRVLRKGSADMTYPDASILIAGLDDASISQRVNTGAAKKGAYTFENLPAGAYRLYISEGHRGDGTVDVVVRAGELLKLDLDLAQIPMHRRPPKPYGAPPARRRIV